MATFFKFVFAAIGILLGLILLISIVGLFTEGGSLLGGYGLTMLAIITLIGWLLWRSNKNKKVGEEASMSKPAKVLSIAFIALVFAVVSWLYFAVSDNLEKAEEYANLPQFTFKNISASTPLSELKEDGTVKNCKLGIRDDEIDCKWGDPNIADFSVISDFVTFENDKLISLSAAFNHKKYNDIYAALKSAYGKPCNSKAAKLQNAFGARFNSREHKWCFKDGELVITEQSEHDLRMGDIMYYMYSTEKEKPKKYKPSEL